jgi:PIN domain nuclease of toxin-antitoxin system
VILLDTHVMLWLALEPRRLSKPAARELSREPQRLVADISLREIALLHAAGRVDFDDPLVEWVEDALEELGIQVVGITPRIAARSVRIAQGFHGDPADQLIAATAIELDVPLVTADERLRASSAVRTVW